MSNQIWIALTFVALLAGLALGVWAGGRVARQALLDKLRGAEKDLADLRAMAGQEAAGLRMQAVREVEQARLQGQRQLDVAHNAHRVETEKLARHLTEACDELEKLRRQVAAGSGEAADTQHGFPATMPMSDT